MTKRKFNLNPIPMKTRRLLSISVICLLILLIVIYLVSTTIFNKSNTLTAGQAPPSKYSSITVCLDPGHGGYDVGANSSSTSEKDLSLSLTLKVGELLKNKGINVVYTRTDDSVPWPSDNKLDLRQRIQISKDYESDIFVSIHYNHNNNTSYRGYEIWTRFKETEGDILSKSILEELNTLSYSKNRGIKYEGEKSLRVLKDNPATSVLLELGFLSNSSDYKYLTSSSGEKELAESISDGIFNYVTENLDLYLDTE